MRDFGLVDDLRELSAYILGTSPVPTIPFKDDGNWEDYLPRYESQSTRFETYGCAVWGSQNQIETLYKFLYGDEPNYSERFNYLLAGVVPGVGIDPQKVYECIRHDGLIDERLMPMTDTLTEFIDKEDVTGTLLAYGQRWLGQHDFRHEWLWTNRPSDWKDVLRRALKTSPIGVSVTAWESVNGLYVSNGPNNHWVLLYKIDEDGSMWIFDTYDHSRKQLHPDHLIKRAKRIWLNKKTVKAERQLITLLQDLIKRLMQQKTLLDVCKESLGTDASPLDAAPDELGCADTVTTLMRKVWPYVPHMVSTAKLHEWLQSKGSGFVRVLDPQPGTIIISPTNGSVTGHVGVYLENEVIASNDSGIVIPTNKGKFLANYTTRTWNMRFNTALKLPVYLYRHE